MEKFANLKNFPVVFQVVTFLSSWGTLYLQLVTSTLCFFDGLWMFGGIRDLTVIPGPSGHRSQTWIVAFMWSSERPKTSDPQFSTRKHLPRCKNLARWPVLKTADSLLGIQVRSLTFFNGRNFRDSYTWLSLTRLLAMFSVEKVLIGTDGIQTRDSVFFGVFGGEKG